MLPIVEIPPVVRTNMTHFDEIFSKPQRDNFSRYVTGLIISGKPSIKAINSMFLEKKNQSSMNRFLTESDWDEEEMNNKRIEMLQKNPDTRWNSSGVVSIDDTIEHKTGKKIEGADYVFDHCENKSVLGFDIVTSQYVDQNKHYPISLRPYFREKTLEEDKEISNKFQFKSRIILACELVGDAERRGVPVRIYVFDSWYFVDELTDKVESYEKFWVTRMKSNRLVMYKGKAMQIAEFAKQLPDKVFRKIKIGHTEYYTFTKSMKLANNKKKARIVISHKEKDRSDDPYLIITNNLMWESKKIVETYSLRNPIEPFYRDVKQNLGFEGSQLRDIEGRIKHWHMVFVAYSLLKLEICCSRLSRCLNAKLTIGKRCFNTALDVLQSLITLAYKMFSEKKPLNQILEVLVKR